MRNYYLAPKKKKLGGGGGGGGSIKQLDIEDFKNYFSL